MNDAASFWSRGVKTSLDDCDEIEIALPHSGISVTLRFNRTRWCGLSFLESDPLHPLQNLEPCVGYIQSNARDLR